ncbi:MAG: RecB family exonuclease, partial [Fidelibacterota bacterium]
RIDHDGDGNWEIHDYKTGKRALSQKAADKDHQLALYQIGLMSEIDNIKSVKLVWHFIQHGIKVESTRTSEDIKKVIAETKSSIDDIRQKVKNGGEFPPKTTMLCNWCYYWEECPAQHGTNPNII